MNFAGGARGGAHGARGTYATLHNDVRRGACCVKMLLHGVWIEVLKTSLKYIVFLIHLELFYWVCESESRLKRATIHKCDHVVRFVCPASVA